MTNTQCLKLKYYEVFHYIYVSNDTDRVRYGVYTRMYILVHNVHQSTTPNEPVPEALSYSRWGEVKCFSCLQVARPASFLAAF